MLSHISITNYTIVSALEMEFAPGMTVITGETGAGKSIMLDALGLCLGDRADTKALRPGAERADITAGFDISAMAMTMRCCWPPESWCGNASRMRFGSGSLTSVTTSSAI